MIALMILSSFGSLFNGWIFSSPAFLCMRSQCHKEQRRAGTPMGDERGAEQNRSPRLSPESNQQYNRVNLQQCVRVCVCEFVPLNGDWGLPFGVVIVTCEA